MTQRRWTPLRSTLLPLTLFLVCSGFGECNGAEVLAFDPPPGLDANETVADLTDAQAAKVCAWLIATYPLLPGESVSNFSNAEDSPPTPGYLSGNTYGATCGNRQVTLVFLTEENCLLNLRHSPCQATLERLERCVSSVQSAIEAEAVTLSASGAQCDDAGVEACNAFEAAASCDETVLQTNPRQNLGYGGGLACVVALPVQPGVTCPPTVDEPLLDGGTYSVPEGCGGPDDLCQALLPDGAPYSAPDAQTVDSAPDTQNATSP
jgi:hypothetical protein